MGLRFGRRKIGLVFLLLCLWMAWWVIHHQTTSAPRHVQIVKPRQWPHPQKHVTPKHQSRDRLETMPLPTSPPNVLIHLDLKGAPPRMSYLHALLPLLVKGGASGLLVEWEDMFPYGGMLVNASATNHYTLQDVKEFAQAAKKAGLVIVPLVQTLGHLEYVLKLQEWQHLRENTQEPAEACASHPETSSMVIELLDQVMEALPETTMVHLGADEVFNLGTCPRCRITEKSAQRLYLDHVSRVATHASKRYQVRVLIWDDMIRGINQGVLRESELGTLVEPVVWFYGEDVVHHVPPYVLRTYTSIFPRIWLGTAFKGAFGPRAFLPDASRHAKNNLAWSTLGNRMSLNSGVRVGGVALTGWSRYDHFAELCELLVVSIPSLALSLLVSTRGAVSEALLRDLHELLECPDHVTLAPARDPHLWAARGCDFPGSNALVLLHQYAIARDATLRVQREAEDKGAWLTPFNIRRNFSSPRRVRESVVELTRLAETLQELTRDIRKVLTQYYDVATAEEWLEQHILPLQTVLNRMNQSSISLLQHHTWPRRPLPILNLLPRPPPPPPSPSPQ
ncbi:hexosaminidase D-like [Oratosquilla oratoria]|uniref:hexosaminidase D-like n=1 Tax=Oratosquilla oratoria TaxID=337810 RepID=UPI003F75BE01